MNHYGSKRRLILRKEGKRYSFTIFGERIGFAVNLFYIGVGVFGFIVVASRWNEFRHTLVLMIGAAAPIALGVALLLSGAEEARARAGKVDVL